MLEIGDNAGDRPTSSGSEHPVTRPCLADRNWATPGSCGGDHQHPDRQLAVPGSGLQVHRDVAGVDVGNGGHEGMPEQTRADGKPPGPARVESRGAGVGVRGRSDRPRWMSGESVQRDR